MHYKLGCDSERLKKAKEDNKTYFKKYYQQPEVRKKIRNRRREYIHRPEVKKKRKMYRYTYNRRPEVKEKRKVWNRRYKQKLKNLKKL